MNPLLQVKSLKKVCKQKNLIAVNKIDFHIDAGECFGLIGESGSGKSTTANMIAGFTSLSSGEIIFNGTSMPAKSCARGFKLRHNMQMIFQNPISSFSPKMTLLKSVCEGLRYQNKISTKEIECRAIEAIKQVGLDQSYANRFCSELSGGECQRAAIARAIISKPKLLICDEATSALDVSVQARIIELLMQLKKETGLSYLFITHDIALISNISDRIAVMKEGTILDTGKPSDVIGNPGHPYTKKLIISAEGGI